MSERELIFGRRSTTVERAFELAMTGSYVSLITIRDRLTAEGYFDAHAHLAAPSLRAHLRRLCVAARTKPGSR
jgi:hypothetical protein